MRDQATREPAEPRLRPSAGVAFLFLFLSVGIVAGGFLLFRKYQRQYLAQAENQLSAIAELKVAELVQWRKERLGDAAVFLHDKPFVEFIRRLVDHPEDADLRRRILGLLGIIRTSYQYDLILVVDPLGNTLASVPETESPAEAWPGIAEILLSRRIAFLDLHRDTPGRPVHLALVVPLLEEGSVAPLGAVILRIDPEIYLYPFIRRWPVPSRTAETLLLRREGDEVVYLNDLRFEEGIALEVRRPLSDKSLPAAAAIQGHVGILRGRDYRGVPVLADVRPVPDSPWHLVARMDEAEVYGPMKARLWMTLGLIAALIFGTGAASWSLWRRQSLRFFQARYETEKKLRLVSARHDALLSAVPDIIMEVDADKKYVWANPAGLAFFGEDVIGREAALYFEGDQETYRAVQPLFTGREGAIYVESWQRRKDGQKRLLAWWCRVLKDEEGRVSGALSSGRDITEQTRAEEELSRNHRELQDSVQQLEQSRNMLQWIIESIPVRVFWKSRDLRYLGCNSLFARDASFGSPQEIIGKDDFDMGWKDQADRYRKDDLQVMESRHPKMDIVEPQTTPSGATIWISTSKVPLLAPDGEVFGILGVYEDITGRRRAAEALRESEKKFRSLFDEMTEGVALHEIVYDAQGRAVDYRILDANPAFERQVGIAPDKVRGRLASEVYGSPAPYLETYERIAASSQPENFETFFKPVDKHLLISAFSMKRGTFATVFEDVSERKRAEEELRRSASFLSTIIDKSPLAMWVSDESGTMIKMNPALGRLLNVTPEELVGKYNVLRDDIVESQGHMAEVREVFEKGLTARFPLAYDVSRLRQLKFTGRASVNLDITISPVVGGEGRVTNAVLQIVDVTERVRAEEALRASLREKEVLLREIHHRVKNNMQVISSLLNLQSAQVADPKIRDAFKESQIRIRAMALVHEKLYGSGDLSHIDFADYLRKLCIHLGQAFAIASDRIGIRFDMEEISLDINSAIPCGLIATELIANAMKHAFPEGRRGTITITLTRAGEGRIRMTISDDGIGFPRQIDFRETDSLACGS